MSLGVYSIYNTVQEEAERKESRLPRGPSQILKEEFSAVFHERGVTVAVIIACGFALVAEAIGSVGGVPIWVASYAVIDGLLLFFLVETGYHLVSRLFPPSLRVNKLFGGLMHIVAFSGSLLVASSVFSSCLYDLPLCALAEPVFFWLSVLIFSSFLFISGLGGIGMIATLSNTLSSHVPRGRRSHPAYILALFGIFAGLLLLLNGNRSVFGTNTAVVTTGIEIAFIVGIGYSLYWTGKKKEVQHSPTIVYAFLMLGISALFIGYSLNDKSITTLSASLPTLNEALPYAIPLTLFAVGYANLVFWLPRRFERTIGGPGGAAFASVTFLMLFAVLSVYEGSAHSFGPAIFLLQTAIPALPALLIGGLIFSAGKVRAAEKWRNIGTDAIVPFCTFCDAKLDRSSKYCWSCGKAVPLRPEKVSFTGHAILITKKVHNHSAKRRLATTLIGGPVGYLTFGRNLTLRQEREGGLAVTDRALYFDGEPIPMRRISGIKKGHYSDSIILTLKKGDPPSQTGASEMEFRTNDVEFLAKSVNSARDGKDTQEPSEVEDESRGIIHAT